MNATSGSMIKGRFLDKNEIDGLIGLPVATQLLILKLFLFKNNLKITWGFGGIGGGRALSSF